MKHPHEVCIIYAVDHLPRTLTKLLVFLPRTLHYHTGRTTGFLECKLLSVVLLGKVEPLSPAVRAQAQQPISTQMCLCIYLNFEGLSHFASVPVRS